MNDILGMDVLHAFADLTYETCARFLAQREIFADDPLEQLAAVNTGTMISKNIDLYIPTKHK